jgi:hypothetical protein
MHTHTRICRHIAQTLTYAYTGTHMHRCMQSRMDAWIQTYTHTHTQTQTHTHTHTHTHDILLNRNRDGGASSGWIILFYLTDITPHA